MELENGGVIYYRLKLDAWAKARPGGNIYSVIHEPYLNPSHAGSGNFSHVSCPAAQPVKVFPILFVSMVVALLSVRTFDGKMR